MGEVTEKMVDAAIAEYERSAKWVPDSRKWFSAAIAAALRAREPVAVPSREDKRPGASAGRSRAEAIGGVVSDPRELSMNRERASLRAERDLELLAKLRAHPQLPVFLELMATKREDCIAEVKYCESRCEDDVIAVARQCLELVESVTKLLRGEP